MKPASLELPPLNDEELNLCLQLVKTHTEQGLHSLIQAVTGSITKGCYSPRKLNSKSRSDELLLADWKHNAEVSLRCAQSKWIRAAIGPIAADNWVDPEGFDAWLFNHPPFEDSFFRMPRFRLEKFRVAGKPRWPKVRIAVEDAEDIFDWYLLRAICNLQVSRIAICVVCGMWELKNRFGRRSRAKQTLRYKKRIRKLLDEAWFPDWPAVCSKPDCKNTFQNVMRGKVTLKRNPYPFRWLEAKTLSKGPGIRVEGPEISF